MTFLLLPPLPLLPSLCGSCWGKRILRGRCSGERILGGDVGRGDQRSELQRPRRLGRSLFHERSMANPLPFIRGVVEPPPPLETQPG